MELERVPLCDTGPGGFIGGENTRKVKSSSASRTRVGPAGKTIFGPFCCFVCLSRGPDGIYHLFVRSASAPDATTHAGHGGKRSEMRTGAPQRCCPPRPIANPKLSWKWVGTDRKADDCRNRSLRWGACFVHFGLNGPLQPKWLAPLEFP
ncbi:hypothetical protein BRADI_1g44985v3 [Brachypodium distachyon]|uniref:Uncharacterized protein n=1 Tax=Brachypodium distachyon TaxID=15368 RepID=A0A2K2DPE2_BRADI|nr:hypothetical protein BRADI_1g44985v3 [Brachypodium distachyon]